MRLLFPLFLIPLLFAGALSPARAAFNPALVAGDAQWVVYLDLNRLRETRLGKELIGFAQKQASSASTPANVTLNIDKILTTAGSLTAYGSNFVPDPAHLDGALIAQGTPELRKIIESVVIQASLAAKEIVEEKGLPFDAYRLSGDVLIGFPTEPIVLVSKSKTQLVKAHDVFRGAAPSLAKTPSSPLAPLLSHAPRAYLTAASVVPAELSGLPDGPQARILQLMNGGAVALGENGDKATAHLELVAPTADAATKVHKIVDGMTAMLSLAETTDQQLAEFLRSTSVARDGRKVTLDLAYSSERLVQMFNTMQQGGRAASAAAHRAAAAAAQPVAKVLGKWSLEGAPASTPPGENTLASRKFENVRLVTGATVTLLGERRGSQAPEGARLDAIEIAPAAGGAPLRFEAENLKLSRYRPANAAFASGRRLVTLPAQNGSASFEFPGADGDYTITVRYVDEADATSSLSLTVREPAPVTETR